MKRLFRKILYRIIPELRILRDRNHDYSLLRQWEDKIDNIHHIIIYAPYSVSDTTIGDYTYIAPNSHISKTNIGKYCSIGPNLLCGWGIHPTNGISTSPMFYSTRRQNGTTLSTTDKVEERKTITIGNDVFIGANVTILDGVTIGDGAVIGAGAVVSKDIPPYAIAVGCPIEIKRYRLPSEQISALQKIKWWDCNEEMLKDVERHFFDVEKFINSVSK